MPTLAERLQQALARPGGPPVGRPVAGDDMPLPARLVAAAVLVPILGENELLLTTRTAQLKQHPGQVAFPGGRIEADDSGPVAAALREAHEEVGLPPERVEILGLSDRYRTGTGFEVQPVVGQIRGDVALTLNPSEVADSFRVPLSFALDPANHHIRQALWQGRQRRFYEIRWKDRVIWGATAGMLVNLAARLA